MSQKNYFSCLIYVHYSISLDITFSRKLKTKKDLLRLTNIYLILKEAVWTNIIRHTLLFYYDIFDHTLSFSKEKFHIF